MPPQSPAAGLAVLVVPPMVSSLIEVKVMGLDGVPTASRVPSTVIPPGPSTLLPLKTAPGATVRVMPDGSSNGQPPSSCQGACSAGRVPSVVTVPPRRNVGLPPDAEFPPIKLGLIALE